MNAPPVRPLDAPPPIWQGTARHGDYAEVLSRNPNGTFQVRIRGQEETRTERDVAYMTGMNKPALDAHLDGVMAGRKVGQSPRVESDSAQVVDQTTVRTPTGPHGPLRQLMDQVTQILERLLPGLIGRDVHLLTSAEDLLNSDYARQRERPFTADEVAAIQQSEGFHDPLTGQSFVFAGQVISKPWESQQQAVLRVMLHEAIGHGGVNRLLAGNEKARRNFDHLVGKIMELDPEGFQALAADPAYAHLKGDTRALALEWLAQKSETRPDLLRKPNLLTHLRNVLGQAISDLQVKLGLRPETGADLDRRVDIFLHQARQAAMRGGAVDPNFAGNSQIQYKRDKQSPAKLKALPKPPSYKSTRPIAPQRGIQPKLVKRATFGLAKNSDYRKTYFSVYPHLEGKVVVHHAVEQAVLHRYPGLVNELEMHSIENLRGIPNEVNADLHLSLIRKKWNAFYRQNANPSKVDLLDFATKIDQELGSQFNPKLHP